MDEIGIQAVAASLSLVFVGLGLSVWLQLGLTRPIIEASIRAALQLGVVGVAFLFIFDNRFAHLWAWLWVLAMVTIASFVVRRRAPSIPGLAPAMFGSTFGSTGVALALLFGLGVFEREPVTIVVIAGITIGNVLPAAVLAAKQLDQQFKEQSGQVEALLALGMDRRRAMMFIAPIAARTALTGQIERTKVVGLIALPGAMTGLLLAGVPPVEAVMVQVVVMYLILGTAIMAVVTVVWIGARQAFTPDLRLADWAQPRG